MSPSAPVPPPPEPQAHRALARDDTAIAWYEFPARPEANGRPPVVLTTGLGTTPNFWSPLVEALSPEHRVVRWDYRGHGGSEVPRTRDYSMATQGDDLRRVTEAISRGSDEPTRPVPAVHVGFSMGVTVVLELYRRHPELVRGMVLIAGGADHPYATSPAFEVPGVHAAVRAGLGVAAPFIPLLRPFTRRLSRSSKIFPLGQSLGALGADAPRAELEHFFQAVGDMDPGAYWATLRALVRAHASDVLPTVSVPVLIVAPSHDIMAPRGDLEQLQDSIPRATWFQVPRTGHAILLEAGDTVAAAVRTFLRGLV